MSAPALSVHPLPREIVALDGAPPPLPPALEAEVGAVWEAEARQRGGALFNGLLFCVETLDAARLTGRFVEYRRFLAQSRRPGLSGLLGIRPLGVSGLLRVRDGIVFGRRSGAVAHGEGRWELAPAGGVDPGSRGADGRIDPIRQIVEELGEETGIAAAWVVRAAPFCLVEDSQTGLFDLAIGLEVDLSGGEAREFHRLSGSREYDALEVVPPAGVPGFVAARSGAFLDVSLFLLRRSGLL